MSTCVTQWSLMKLEDYLHSKKIKNKEFIKQVGISHQTFYRIINGHDINLSTAKLIVDATKGQVSYEDLIKLEKKLKNL